MDKSNQEAKPVLVDTSQYDSVSGSDNFESTTKMQLQELEKEHKLLKVVTFGLGGLLIAYAFTLISAELDIFSEIYEGKDYSFYSIIPSYIQIPASILLTNYQNSRQFSTKFNIVVNTLGVTIFFCIMPIITLFFPSTWFYMILGLAFYTVASFFHATFQAMILTVASMYDSRWTAFLYGVYPLCNFLIVGVKTFIVFMKFSHGIDFLILWGIFILLTIGFLIAFLKLTNTEFYQIKMQKKVETKAKKGTQTQLNYTDAFKTIKYQSLGLFIAYFSVFLSFPGFYFSVTPLTLFSSQKFILALNVVSSVFDFLGRPFGATRVGKPLARCGTVFVMVANIFLMWSFFSDFYLKEEGICYTMLVLVALYNFLIAVATTHYMSEASKLTSESNQDAAGSIMVNSLLSGIAIGNIISSTLATFKRTSQS